MSFHKINLHGEDIASSISTQVIRNNARWEHLSNHFTTWIWFSKHFIESEGVQSHKSSLEEFQRIVNSLQKFYPKKFTSRTGKAKEQQIFKFKKLLEYFWSSCFAADLVFDFVKDIRFENGLKIVANKRVVSQTDVASQLLGFVEPLSNFFNVGEYACASEVEKAELEKTFSKHYCSIITFQDDKVYALYGPLAYVNHDCQSRCVYAEDTYLYEGRERKRVVLDYFEPDNMKELYYRCGEEITVRYVLSDAESLPFDEPCQCNSCMNSSKK